MISLFSINILFSVITELSLQRCKEMEGWLSIKLKIHMQHLMLPKHGKVQVTQKPTDLSDFVSKVTEI